MGLINVKTAAKMLGLRDGFEAAARLAQAGYKVVTIEKTRYVSRDSVAEYAAEIA